MRSKRADKLRYEVQQYRKKRVIVDTDAACEADDPFAIVHALMSKMLEVKAIFATHFNAESSMERSYDKIKEILVQMEQEVPVYYGEKGRLDNCPEGELSPAAEYLIKEALQESEAPLYVLCMGAITNVAAALRKCPEIAKKMTIVWIGGNPLSCQKPAWREFNSGNDIAAANLVLQSGAEVWMIPSNVYGTMHIGFAEMQKRIASCGRIGAFLYENLIDYYSSENASWSAGESWSLGDSPAVGVTLEPNCGSYIYAHAPIIQEDTSNELSEETPMIRIYQTINSRFILEDFMCKLEVLYGEE